MRNKIIGFFIMFLFSINSAKAASYMYLGSSADSKVYIYDVTNLAHTLVGSVDVGKDPAGIAVSLDGSRVYVVNNGSKSISVINTSTNTKIADVTVGPSPFSIVVDPDDSRIFVANVGDSTLSVIDAKKIGVDSNPLIGTPIATGKSPAGLAITQNGTRKRLYVVNLIDGTISVFDISTSDIKSLTPFDLKNIAVAPTFERPVGIAAKNDFLYVTHNEAGSKKSYVSVFQETDTGIRYLNASREVGLLPQQAVISDDFKFLYVASANPVAPSISVLDVSNIDKSKIGIALDKKLSFIPNGLSITPDGQRIYIPSTSIDGFIAFADKQLNNSVTTNNNSIFKKSITIGKFISPDLNATLAASPSSIDFGKQNLNSGVPSQTATLTYQFVPSMINSITSNSGDFPISHNCEISVQKPMGTTCTVTVNFQSGSVGDKTGSVVIESNASNNRLEIPLKGTIQDPNAPSPDTNGGGNNGGGCSILSNEITFGFGLLNLLWLTPLVYLRLKRARQR